MQVSERTLRLYKSKYNKANPDNPIALVKNGRVNFYGKTDLEKLKVFVQPKKSNQEQNNDNNAISSKKSATRKMSTIVKAEELKIDEGFKTLIRPLVKQEFNQLEESILQNGILNPVIVTSDYVVIDGHYRYAIAAKHNLPIPINIVNYSRP